ncbi:NAD(+) diphosphatase [Fibrobacter sp. UWEL]|uniref:NAD(+) diphosphatase n=1 Tax=Fibrobacter sp. UWEL TaxID=1896209 RepID=UPI00091BF682|nr:NAD(+) diphosphatase [Fibrobacter sp. UWEL]SHL43344.1 NAD+ diphosphatase [Fibrobacter sp. UWEL]
MIHEIAPHVLDNQFKIQDPKPNDYCLVYNGSKSLLKKEGNGYALPTVAEIQKLGFEDFEGHYLLNIDERAFFLLAVAEDYAAPEGYEFTGNRAFRPMAPVERLGGATAAHIAHWEALNKFCGKCGNVTIRGEKERSIICPKCGNVVYPRISPVVIIAVRNGDKLLMAHNIDNPNPMLFLISGFVEVGESLEQAAHREVMEEAGVKIKNLKYFGSQPWPFSDSLIAGWTAELDGDDTIHMQAEELSEALWVKREDIPPYATDVSISCCLIENFRTGFTLPET